MRRLSAGIAIACEQATTPRCRCRCGGRFHGADRVRSELELLDELPVGDPHHPDTEVAPGPPRPRPAPAGPGWRQLRIAELETVDDLVAELLR